MPEDRSTTSLLDLQVTDGPHVLIELAGELDPATAPLLEKEIERLLSAGRVDRLILDLSGLSFLDSSGLRVFVAARESLGTQGGELALRAPSANVQRLLDVTGLGEIIAVE